MAGPRTLSRRHAMTLGVVAATAGGHASAQPVAAPGGDSAAQALLAARVTAGEALGYVAVILDVGNVSVVTAGQSGAADGRALGGDTVFEIGSVTKVFTALLLAEMAQTGEVSLSDPVAAYLPPEGRPQAFDGKAMTLLDLATYTSGLPRMPGNIHSADPANPYADYTTAQLYQAVAGFKPVYYPGSQYEYANLGIALLGQALALRAGRSYEDLLVSRICAPLGLDDTRITLTPGMRSRLAPGHDPALRPVSNWDLPAVAGAGALRSTANDLARFVACCSGRVGSPLAGAASRLLDRRHQTDVLHQYAAAGWFVRNQYGEELVLKDGDTGGYTAFIGYSTHGPRGAIVLSNTSTPISTLEIGMHLVNPAFPLPALAVAISPADLAALSGRYAVEPGFILTVAPKDGHLAVQATAQPALDFLPEGRTRFFCRLPDAQLTFRLGPDGTATSLVLHQGGKNLPAPRLP